MKLLELTSARPIEEQQGSKTTPYAALFRDAVLSAQDLRASDIHFQPSREGVDIRFRIDGDLSTWKSLGVEHRQSLLNEVKRLSQLSIAVSGRAQDGRVSFKNWQLDVRSSLIPSQYGEKIVLRLLDLRRKFEFDRLGFDEAVMSDLRQALSYKTGAILISGPTGSGKTTTLYTLLCALDRVSKNIITLEDPIEYGIDGLTQVQVSSKLGFADALRAVVRQDPDVILVGEIRDRETADLCFKAAATGHLVLSTLHANGAQEVVGRLLNLGVEPYMLQSCLRFSAAQRLVKRLCAHCSLGTSDGAKTRSARGCDRCRSGIAGRVPVLEYMTEDSIQSYLADPRTLPRMRQSLREAAAALAEKGVIDAADVSEVA